MAIYGMTYETLFQIWQDTGYGAIPALGLDYGDFHVTMRKTGQGFTLKTLTAQDVVELTDGWYVFKWSVSDMDSIGEFYCHITPLISGGQEVARFFEVLPPPQYSNNAHPTCIVTGNVIDISGLAQTSAQIIFRPKNVPIVAGPSLVSATRLVVWPDAFGCFSVELLRNVQVIVEIESAGIRQLITVPNLATAPIISLLPPVPPPL